MGNSQAPQLTPNRANWLNKTEHFCIDVSLDLRDTFLCSMYAIIIKKLKQSRSKH